MGYTISTIIAVVLWFTFSTISVLEYLPQAKELPPGRLAIFFLVFLIGGPVFGIYQMLTTILNFIMPEGWDNDDDFNEKH